MDIHAIEKILHQGKLSFASEKRMEKYPGVKPGSVTPFGLMNDTENHVHLFPDRSLRNAARLSFHPGVNTASLIVSRADFIRFPDDTGNGYEWLELY
jgi:Ala-tRNA(Pro) deacylase